MTCVRVVVNGRQMEVEPEALRWGVETASGTLAYELTHPLSEATSANVAYLRLRPGARFCRRAFVVHQRLGELQTVRAGAHGLRLVPLFQVEVADDTAAEVIPRVLPRQGLTAPGVPSDPPSRPVLRVATPEELAFARSLLAVLAQIPQEVLHGR